MSEEAIKIGKKKKSMFMDKVRRFCPKAGT